MSNKDLLTNRKRGNQFEPKKPSMEDISTTIPVEKPKKKKKLLNATVAVTKRTRDDLNNMRKLKEYSNVDDLVQAMLQKEYDTLSDRNKMKYDLMRED